MQAVSVPPQAHHADRLRRVTDELEPTSPKPGEITPEVLARIEANYAEMRDFADSVPDNMPVTKHLLHFYAVHIDEDNDMRPPQDPINTQVLGAIAALERRLAALESLLIKNGPPRH